MGELITKPENVNSASRPYHLTPLGNGQFAIEQVMTREEAEKIYFDLLAHKFDGSTNWVEIMNLATAMHIIGQSDEALKAAIWAVNLSRNTTTLLNLAVILEAYGRFRESLGYITEAVKMDPTNQFAGLLWAQGLLRSGNWENAWRPFCHYCWQRQWDELGAYLPEWNGEPIKGKKLLVLQGGGIGDNLMFMRWIGEAKKAGAHITYAVMDYMEPLFRGGHPWVDEFTWTHESPESDNLPEFDIFTEKDGKPCFDYFVPLMKLAEIFKAKVETVPWDGPYIKADPELVKLRRMCVDRSVMKKVGICWKAAEVLDPRRHRSLTDEQMRQIVDVPGIDWVSLQYQISVPEGTRISEPSIKTLADTAAIIECCDFVVTVDTAQMHLAGAMGKPAWVILPSLSDWKFLTNRTDSPFYPSLRLFRNHSEQIGLQASVDSCIKALKAL